MSGYKTTLKNRIDLMMNPDATQNNDKIKIMMHIDPMLSTNQYMRINTLKAYMRANLEGQKL